MKRDGVLLEPRQQNSLQCPVCSKVHKIYTWPEFLKKTTPERFELISRLQRCHNCLGAHDATNCQSTKRCCKRHKQHHSFLHDDGKPIQINDRSNRSKVKQCHFTNPLTNYLVTLGTIQAQLQEINGVYQPVRCIF